MLVYKVPILLLHSLRRKGEEKITIFGNFVSFMIRIINDTKEGVTKLLRHIFVTSQILDKKTAPRILKERLWCCFVVGFIVLRSRFLVI